MFPSINRRPVKSVIMPKLSGGINLRDSVSMIEDNQLSDGVNVWYKDAGLKTRPGIHRLSSKYLLADTRGEEITDLFAESHATDIRREIDGKEYRLFTTLVGKGDDERIVFYLVSESDVIELPSIYGLDHAENLGIKNHIVIEKGEAIHCFLVAGGNNLPEKKFIWTLESIYGEWERIAEAKLYIPLVFKDGNMNHIFAGPTVTFSEDYNLLHNRYKVQFHADSSEINIMRYLFIERLEGETRNNLLGQKVIARLTDKDGNVVIHTATLTKTVPSYEAEVGSDGLRMEVWYKSIIFKDANGEDVAVPDRYCNLQNNFEFELPFWNESVEQTKATVFNMKNPIWFGGTSKDVNSGARLFLYGSTEGKEKNLVLYSDLNNPFYFPKNNYFYVGDSSQYVTGLAMQSEMLVIFKERETYYTYYKQGAEYNASAYPPPVQIHGWIGCDCPNTIQLCRNRLVWATSNGKVYTLVASSQYSKRDIYEVSGLIERRFKKETGLKNAFACEWNGHYLLICGGHIYVMDYNSYGYQYVSSHYKNEDSNLKIPWWYWEIPEFSENNPQILTKTYCVNVTHDTVVMGVIKMIKTETEQAGTVQYFYNEFYKMNTKENDDSIYLHDLTQIPVSQYDEPLLLEEKRMAINTYLQTKIFDFDIPHKNKAISLVNVSFGNNGGEPIFIKYVTENGEYLQESIVLSHNDTTEYSAGYVTNKPLRPAVGLVNRFGLKIECEGDMAIDAISIDYRPVGTTR